jgi:hypothetical protein
MSDVIRPHVQRSAVYVNDRTRPENMPDAISEASFRR